VLAELVGREVTTISGRPNKVLSVEGEMVMVATTRSLEGARVPIVDVQMAIDRLFAVGSLEIRPRTVGYRSAFIGAVLKSLPTVQASLKPARVELVPERGGPATSPWHLKPGDRVERLVCITDTVAITIEESRFRPRLPT
jgi:hypothetical protein